MVKYLFVYGWLKSRYRYSLSEKMEFPDFPLELEGQATVSGTLFRVAEYPGYAREGDEVIHGELYRLPEKFDWTLLDSFEHAFPLIRQGYEYSREVVDVDFGRKLVPAYIYIYMGKNRGEKIASGIF